METRVTTFLSTYVNKVDQKGRVSVPAPFRAALSGQRFEGIIAFPSLTNAAVDAFGRDALERMNQQRFDQNLGGGEFERLLIGDGEASVVEAIMAMVHELPFDGEGRILLPVGLSEHAGITERAAFVGRGNRFQIWDPDAFAKHQGSVINRLRSRLNPSSSSSPRRRRS